MHDPVLGLGTCTNLWLDDPSARNRGVLKSAAISWIGQRTGRNALQRRGHHGRPRLHLNPVYGRTACHHPGQSGRQSDRSGL